MALFAKVAAFFKRAPLSRPRHPNSTAPVEMAYMDWFGCCGSNALLGDNWEFVSREEIADASRQRVAFMHTRLDAKNAAARNVQRQNPTPFDINESEVDGFLMLDTPHQTALNFGKLMDAFNKDLEEPSLTFSKIE